MRRAVSALTLCCSLTALLYAAARLTAQSIASQPGAASMRLSPQPAAPLSARNDARLLNLNAQQTPLIGLQAPQGRGATGNPQAVLASKRVTVAWSGVPLARQGANLQCAPRQWQPATVLMMPVAPARQETPLARNLLFTQADAAQVKLTHPLLTPETPVKSILVQQEAQPHGR